MRTELADPSLLVAVEAMVRKRVPSSDVDDVVQAALADVIASADAPSEPEAFRRWLSGVVRHKVADFHRSRRREVPLDGVTEPQEAPAHEEHDLLRWATNHLPASGEAKRTLEWMMHEAAGEKLEAIAEREHLPATRVRQRVSRLRAFFREKWHRELVLAALIALLVGVGWYALRKLVEPPPTAVPSRQLLPDPTPPSVPSTPPEPKLELPPPTNFPAIDPSMWNGLNSSNDGLSSSPRSPATAPSAPASTRPPLPKPNGTSSTPAPRPRGSTTLSK